MAKKKKVNNKEKNNVNKKDNNEIKKEEDKKVIEEEEEFEEISTTKKKKIPKKKEPKPKNKISQKKKLSEHKKIVKKSIEENIEKENISDENIEEERKSDDEDKEIEEEENSEEENSEISEKEKEEEEEEKEEEEEEEERLKKKTRVQKTQEAIESLTKPKKTCAIYVGHLPWGFDEKALYKYFTQFGNITRLYCPRSLQSGRMKGYGFIEFNDEQTAEIAAKTMNNYILFDRILTCNVIDEKNKYDKIFKNAKKKFEFNDKYKKLLDKQDKEQSKEEIKKKINLLLEREEIKRKKMKEEGLNINFPGYKNIIEEYNKKHNIK